MHKYFITTLFLFIYSVSSICAHTGLEIMKLVENRPSPESNYAEIEMRLQNARGQERIRAMEMAEGNFDGQEHVLIRFTAPADVRGVGLLTIEQEDGEDQQWLYMPALKRSRRISSSGKNDSFMGSDFNYEDLETTDPEEGRHTKNGTEVINGTECWIVETIPGNKSYSKIIQWIGKESKIIWKAEFYDNKQALLKVLSVIEAEKIDSYWIERELHMKNVQTGHSTTLTRSRIDLNAGLKKRDFSIRNLERGRGLR